jgi:TM2 domain-containing membrane protein YozV
MLKRSLQLIVCFLDALSTAYIILWHTDLFYNNRGMSSLLGNDSANIPAATNTENNSEYIVITRHQATEL